MVTSTQNRNGCQSDFLCQRILQVQTAVGAYFSSEQLLLFAFCIAVHASHTTEQVHHGPHWSASKHPVKRMS